LSDGRPFKDAGTKVNAFFERTEKPLKQAHATVLERLTEAAKQVQSIEEIAPVTPPEPIDIGVSGETVITAVPPQPSQPKSTREEIELTWSVNDFDRANLDLEALRSYFTEAQILAACRKHLDDHGPNMLEGVRYRKVAQ
jgi:hypothetical protein